MFDKRNRIAAQTLAGALGAAVSVYEGGARIFSAPEEFQTADSIAGGKDFYFELDLSDPSELARVENRYGEGFLMLRLSARSELFVGPFLSERQSPASLDDITRGRELSQRARARVKEHLMRLPVFSAEQVFYIGQLLQAFFFSELGLPLPEEELSALPESGDLHEKLLRRTADDDVHPPYFLEKELLRAISFGDKNTTLAALGEYEYFAPPLLSNNDLRSLKDVDICFCAIFTRAAIAGGAAAEDAFSLCDIFIYKLENCSAADELRALRREAACAFCDMVRSARGDCLSPPIELTVQYVKAHLSEKLTLAELADRAHLHPNYLSTLFKRETGESISSFITRNRVRETAKLLRTTDLPSAKIAAAYRFCNQSYFIKTFKRYMGCSPQQYRAQYKRIAAAKR